MLKSRDKKSLKRAIAGLVLVLTLIGSLYGFPIIGISIPFPWESDNPGYDSENCVEQYAVTDDGSVPAICSFAYDRCLLPGLERMKGFPLVMNRAGDCGDGFSMTAAAVNLATGIGSLVYIASTLRSAPRNEKKNNVRK